MIYGAIFAGGKGLRIGGSIPKQYIEINKKPIIIYTIEKFLKVTDFDEIIVLCPKTWIEDTREMISYHLGKNYSEELKKIVVIEGGETRNGTLKNALNHIAKEGQLNGDTIIVTHDGARPFVSCEVILESIEGVKKYGATGVAVPSTDTIFVTDLEKNIVETPKRERLYNAQTPQSFYAKELDELYDSLTDDERESITDAVGIYTLRGKKVHLVEGDINNFKITYEKDLETAKSIIDSLR